MADNANEKWLMELRRLFMRIPGDQELIITATTAGLYPAGTLKRHMEEGAGFGFGPDELPTCDFRLPDGIWPYNEGS